MFYTRYCFSGESCPRRTNMPSDWVNDLQSNSMLVSLYLLSAMNICPMMSSSACSFLICTRLHFCSHVDSSTSGAEALSLSGLLFASFKARDCDLVVTATCTAYKVFLITHQHYHVIYQDGVQSQNHMCSIFQAIWRFDPLVP